MRSITSSRKKADKGCVWSMQSGQLIKRTVAGDSWPAWPRENEYIGWHLDARELQGGWWLGRYVGVKLFTASD
jgi:hypothetical protein